jgi:hypothetical protein
VRWTHPTPGPVLQPVAAAGEVLAAVSAFTADGGAVLELLDVRTGARLARFDGGGEGSLAPPSFAADRVFWSTWDGTVRALAAP